MNYLKKSLICLSIITVIGAISACNSTHSSISSNKSELPSSSSTVNANDTPLKFEYEDLSGNLKTYVNERFKFTLQYPSNWNVKIDKTDNPGSTTGADISPTEGISFYFNNTENERMMVFGQMGHIGVLDGLKESTFSTKNGLKGKFYSSKIDEAVNIQLILDDVNNKYGFYGAYINMSNESYDKYGKLLIGVLRSIKLIEDK
ncbi:hypothetical protein [Clostridium sp. CF012]|uniref:hypothetical protein n=1 Tax=Clostridium sp. CF012 TaxID=2843319 RepID=UPI001C0CAF95|nr:hypothetical protein [Clostridium sp. CF012]MBU3145360.1 hypothetical protein [Clostridium sp. CF012]